MQNFYSRIILATHFGLSSSPGQHCSQAQGLVEATCFDSCHLNSPWNWAWQDACYNVIHRNLTGRLLLLSCSNPDLIHYMQYHRLSLSGVLERSFKFHQLPVKVATTSVSDNVKRNPNMLHHKLTSTGKIFCMATEPGLPTF